MPRTFSLAGLLRLRHVQQEEAAAELARANRRLRETAARRERAYALLEETASAVGDSTTLVAVAAARASSRSMLAALDAVTNDQQSDANRAQAAFNAARAGSIGLEKLEHKHAVALATEDVRAEQGVIDELASTAWHREREGA
ncbi:MAG: hypothetical protein QOD05_1709 [Microbacteriaceae bacterium]|jgi:flagellar FliJ protein|nr:flagellar export protein FliJ [Leifsonia sp.]MDQ1580934.1 hypothetical protein [Microbacteriaceae bacterium]HEV7566974.1 hypothetical protein [Microbacteriaceae bacterium]